MDAIAATARHRSRRGPPAQSACQGGDALYAAAGDARDRHRARFRRLRRPARQGAGRGRLECVAGRTSQAPRRRRICRRRRWRSSSRRAGSARSKACGSPSTRSGLVEVVTGAASVGQGVETVVAQICADALGVDYRRVRVIHGRTDRIAFGQGAFASRVTVMTGEAARLAACELRSKAIEVAAELLQQSPDALDIVDGKIVRKGAAAGPSMTLGEVAKALEPASKLRGGRPPGLTAEGWFYTDHMNYPYGVHIAVLRVDRHTGARCDRALSRRLRCRPGGQSDAGRRPDRRRFCSGARRRAVRGVRLRRARRAAVGQLRRLPDADRARGAARSMS